jgi:hypothetical protein
MEDEEFFQRIDALDREMATTLTEGHEWNEHV